MIITRLLAERKVVDRSVCEWKCPGAVKSGDKVVRSRKPFLPWWNRFVTCGLAEILNRIGRVDRISRCFFRPEGEPGLRIDISHVVVVYRKQSDTNKPGCFHVCVQLNRITTKVNPT